MKLPCQYREAAGYLVGGGSPLEGFLPVSASAAHGAVVGLCAGGRIADYAGFDRNPWLLRSPKSPTGAWSNGLGRESLSLRSANEADAMLGLAKSDRDVQVLWIEHAVDDDALTDFGGHAPRGALFAGFDVGSYRWADQCYSSVCQEALSGGFPAVTELLSRANEHALFAQLTDAYRYLESRLRVRERTGYALESEFVVAMVPVGIWLVTSNA